MMPIEQNVGKQKIKFMNNNKSIPEDQMEKLAFKHADKIIRLGWRNNPDRNEISDDFKAGYAAATPQNSEQEIDGDDLITIPLKKILDIVLDWGLLVAKDKRGIDHPNDSAEFAWDIIKKLPKNYQKSEQLTPVDGKCPNCGHSYSKEDGACIECAWKFDVHPTPPKSKE